MWLYKMDGFFFIDGIESCGKRGKVATLYIRSSMWLTQRKISQRKTELFVFTNFYIVYAGTNIFIPLRLERIATDPYKSLGSMGITNTHVSVTTYYSFLNVA